MRCLKYSTGYDSLGLDEDVCIAGVQHKFTDKLLRDGDGGFVGHTEIRQIIQESDRTDQPEINNVSKHKVYINTMQLQFLHSKNTDVCLFLTLLPQYVGAVSF